MYVNGVPQPWAHVMLFVYTARVLACPPQNEGWRHALDIAYSEMNYYAQ